MDAKLNGAYIHYLFQAMLALETEEECRRFFEDLCTVPELKAMAQRMQVARMLDERWVYTDIVEATGASTATISRVNRSLHYGAEGYHLILDRLKKQTSEDK